MRRFWRLWDWFYAPKNNWDMVGRIFPYSHHVEYRKKDYRLPR